MSSQQVFSSSTLLLLVLCSSVKVTLETEQDGVWLKFFNKYLHAFVLCSGGNSLVVTETYPVIPVSLNKL